MISWGPQKENKSLESTLNCLVFGVMGYLRCGKQTSLVKDGLPDFSDLCMLFQPVLGIKKLQSCLVCAFLMCPTG